MNTISKQEKQFRTDYFDDSGKPVTLIVTVRHDDQCKNGHNTFSITGEIYECGSSFRNGKVKHESGATLGLSSCGQVCDEIEKHMPAIAPLLKWHLTSTDGPMHYIANTVFHVKNRNLDYARSSAVWPNATDWDLLWPEPKLTVRLTTRLPALMAEFKAAVESLGFTY